MTRLLASVPNCNEVTYVLVIHNVIENNYLFLESFIIIFLNCTCTSRRRQLITLKSYEQL